MRASLASAFILLASCEGVIGAPAVDDELSAMKRQLTAGSDAAPEAKALPATPGDAAVEDELAKMKKAAEGN